ncbi:hypothetical protein ELY33_15515 [Vreelandella andesensis]|uniref:Uncharacterized protein n=1 Tax=Vreelandella andesensis TaxID=447567 RepID=A0A433KFI4_9GAMM|nr:hypothetical protein [Halomonas andesensis]RUR27307.1 hypothetical protein ELY33_15515 [Halomonas andesensis]
MNKQVAHNFLPQEQLDLAYSHESIELNRYRWLALSFLPIDPSVSRLMSSIGLECVHRLSSLQKAALQIGLSACINNSPTWELPRFYKNNSRHFFVVDERMGHHLLEHAEEAAYETYVFFNWLLETNATPELYRPLWNCVNQKNNELNIIKECRENWKVQIF